MYFEEKEKIVIKVFVQCTIMTSWILKKSVYVIFIAVEIPGVIKQINC